MAVLSLEDINLASFSLIFQGFASPAEALTVQSPSLPPFKVVSTPYPTLGTIHPPPSQEVSPSTSDSLFSLMLLCTIQVQNHDWVQRNTCSRCKPISYFLFS